MQTAPKPTGTAVRQDPVILRVQGVYKHFPIAGFGGLAVRAVDGVDLEIRRGEARGLVGESGWGKSTLARLITALLPVTRGKIIFEGQEITKMRGARLRRVRRKMQMIFQDPFASLDPRMTVGDIIQEPLDNYGIGSGRDRQRRVPDLPRARPVPAHLSHPPPPLSSRPGPPPIPTAPSRAGPLIVLTGQPPTRANPRGGCRFHTRCPIPRAPGISPETEPRLEPHGEPAQLAACRFAGEK